VLTEAGRGWFCVFRFYGVRGIYSRFRADNVKARYDRK
jgi:hypothetical protein